MRSGQNRVDLFEILGEKLDKFKQEEITLSTFINAFATGNLAVRLLLKLAEPFSDHCWAKKNQGCSKCCL